MTIKKGTVQPLVDQAVQAVMADQKDDPVYSGMQKLQQAKSMTPGKAKKKARDKARTKITFDWPEWLIERLEEIAGQEEQTFPLNQLAAVLVVEGLRAMERGDLDLEDLKIPSRTPAFHVFLKMPGEGDL